MAQRPAEYRGRVATFGAGRAPYIVNAKRSGCVRAMAFRRCQTRRPTRATINTWPLTCADLDGAPLDAPIMHAASSAFARGAPRAVRDARRDRRMGDERRYDLYLDSAFRADSSSNACGNGPTHAPVRGTTPWCSRQTTGAGPAARTGRTMGARCRLPKRRGRRHGPGTPALGVREAVTVTTAQVAATIAALLARTSARACRRRRRLCGPRCGSADHLSETVTLSVSGNERVAVVRRTHEWRFAISGPGGHHRVEQEISRTGSSRPSAACRRSMRPRRSSAPSPTSSATRRTIAGPTWSGLRAKQAASA